MRYGITYPGNGCYRVGKLWSSGSALGLADVLCVLWRKYIRISPEHLQAANRDYFVLSVGHASALYYALLHLQVLFLSKT